MLSLSTKLGGGFKYVLFSPRKLGKISILTYIFQRGWNHQLENVFVSSLLLLFQCRFVLLVYLKLSSRLSRSMQLRVCCWPNCFKVLMFCHWSSKCSWWCEARYTSCFCIHLQTMRTIRLLYLNYALYNWRLVLFVSSFYSCWLFGFIVRRIDPLCIIGWSRLLAPTVKGMHRFGGEHKGIKGAQMVVAYVCVTVWYGFTWYGRGNPLPKNHMTALQFSCTSWKELTWQAPNLWDIHGLSWDHYESSP